MNSLAACGRKKEGVMNLNIVKGRMAVDKLKRIRITELEECISIDLVTDEGIVTIIGYGEDKPNHVPVIIE